MSKTHPPKKHEKQCMRSGKFLKKKETYLLITQIIVTVVSVYVAIKANTLTNAANLIQINSAIQNQTDAAATFEIKYNEYMIASRASGNSTFDPIHDKFYSEEKDRVYTSLLNAYEFACQQYLSRKIDRQNFKSYYVEIIKYIKEENKYSYYLDRDTDKTYTAINKVYKEWHSD
jgi:hypothetical protein